MIRKMFAGMVRLIVSSALVIAIGAASTTAMARSRHQDLPKAYPSETNRESPAVDPNSVYVGGTYAGSDPDPNIRGALIRGFGRSKF
jgi:hypothetical protein